MKGVSGQESAICFWNVIWWKILKESLHKTCFPLVLHAVYLLVVSHVCPFFGWEHLILSKAYAIARYDVKLNISPQGDGINMDAWLCKQHHENLWFCLRYGGARYMAKLSMNTQGDGDNMGAWVW